MNSIKTSSPLRILLVEDDENDSLAFRRAFKKSQVSCEITECVRAEEALARLRADASSFDLVVNDYGLPGMSGLDLCKELLDEEIPLPLVMLTGSGSEQLAVEALKAGVDDYMIKDPGQGYLNLLPVVLPEVVRKHGDRLARKRAEEALRKAHDELEQRVEERTAKLAGTTEKLKLEVAERRQGEEQIRRSQIMLQAVFDGISDPQIMLDRNLVVKMLNRPAAQYYQVEPQDAIGKPCYQACRGRPMPCEGCKIPSAVLSGQHVTFEQKSTVDPDRFEQIVIYPLREKKVEQGAAIVRISDITEAKLMQRQLLQSEKMASLGFLVSGVVHEINNPNHFITFNIPMLRDYLKELIPIVDDYGKEYQDFELFGMPYPEFRKDIFELLDQVEHASSRIKAIVSDLSQFARRKEKDEPRLVDMKGVLEKGVAICRGKIEGMVKFFEVNIPEDLPSIWTDPEAIEQVLINLLINAAQAADKEDSRVRVSVALGNTWRDHLIIEVIDNGCGMDEETTKKVFDPFFTTKAPGAGTGLGLYVCHNLIEGLGGRIEVESAPGEGSTFRVILADKNRRTKKRGAWLQG